jgi:hypothetical protein
METLLGSFTHNATVEFDPDCEAMIITTDGTPLQGEYFHRFRILHI